MIGRWSRQREHVDAAEQILWERDERQAAVDDENRARSTTQGRITVEMKLIGDRPSGETPKESPLVQTAMAVVRALDMTPQLQFSSTDSNIPISMGIPAVTIGKGGTGGGRHSLDACAGVETEGAVPGAQGAVGPLLCVAGRPASPCRPA